MHRKMIVLHYRMQLLKTCEKLNLLVALHSDKYSYLCLFSFSSIPRNSFNHCKGIENCSNAIQKMNHFIVFLSNVFFKQLHVAVNRYQQSFQRSQSVVADVSGFCDGALVAYCNGSYLQSQPCVAE